VPARATGQIEDRRSGVESQQGQNLINLRWRGCPPLLIKHQRSESVPKVISFVPAGHVYRLLTVDWSASRRAM
jgi:hypothetical protein